MSTIDLPSFKIFVGAVLILSAQMSKWGLLRKDDRGRAAEVVSRVQGKRAVSQFRDVRLVVGHVDL